VRPDKMSSLAGFGPRAVVWRPLIYGVGIIRPYWHKLEPRTCTDNLHVYQDYEKIFLSA